MSALAIQVKDLQTALKVEQEKAAEMIGGLETQVKELTDTNATLAAQVEALTGELATVKAAQTELEAKAAEAEEARAALEDEKAEAQTELEKTKAALADPAFVAAKASTGEGQSIEEKSNPTMTAAEHQKLDPMARNAFYRAGGKIVE